MNEKIKCRILRETERAILIRQETGNREAIEAWIPRSQCDHLSKGPTLNDGSREATITMAAWLVDQHNLRAEA